MKQEKPDSDWRITKQKELAYLTNTEPKPEHGKIVIACRQDGRIDQVQINGDQAMLWRYKLTDEPFCDVGDIVQWRYCGGFDF